MLGQVGPTPYDWNFHVLGIPVRVHPLFWVMALVFGLPRESLPGPVVLATLAVLTGCLFVSILVHEMGHALVARHFGWAPEVTLYHLGGYAAFVPTRGYSASRSIAVSLAGPGAGFLLYLLVFGLATTLEQQGIRLNGYARLAVANLEWINLGWGLVNLLPVYPLDGGQVTRALLGAFRPRDGFDLSLKLSIFVSGAMALFFFQRHDQFTGILFAVLCAQNVQMLQQVRSGPWR